jgi:hypothetical protein
MALDGTYGWVYCGAIGIGIGVFTVADGEVKGRDYGGGKYSGTAKERPDGRIILTLAFEVQPGVGLVTGAAAQEVPHTRYIDAELPPNFGDGAPQQIAAPPGVVTVMIKPIPDDFAPAATEGFTMAIARRLARNP